jgi:hypothetical protein
MSDANSTENTVQNIEVGESDKSNVQARIDQLTAEKYAKDEQLKAQAQQIADLVKSIAQRQVEPAREVTQDLPDGIDPSVAKFFQAQLAAQAKAIQANTEQLFWRTQHQLDQQNVNSKYAQMPEEVRQDAARRLTGMKQRYGDAATLEDAFKFAHYDWMLKQQTVNQAARFNGMGGPLGVQSSMPNIGGAQSQSTDLIPPSRDPKWDSYDLETQNKLVSEYEKKGGSLF